MALIIILVALGVQRYLHFASVTYQYNWFQPYFTWCQEKLPIVHRGHGLLGVSIVVLPVVLAVAVLFGLFARLFGPIGEFLLGVALVWYCLDGRGLLGDTLAQTTPEALFKHRYQTLFAGLFWFFILGPAGLVLYVTVVHLCASESEQTEQAPSAVAHFAALVLGILDWVPVRVLGLTFALAGNFVNVFKAWLRDLNTPIRQSCALVATWGVLALGGKSEDGSSSSRSDVAALLERTLVIWLVVMAVFTLGFWFG